jgi:hypothetical protein
MTLHSKSSMKSIYWKMRRSKHPLKSSVRRWFSLSFCTPFSALHSSARNHAAWFSMFKTSGEHSGTCLGSISVSGSITDTGIEPITSPAEKAVATTGRHLSNKKEKFIFLIYRSTKSERAKILNPAAEQRSSPQGCTVRPETSAGESSLGGV